MAEIIIYDTTLRDGEQAEEISFSVKDKLLITSKLDELGVHFIEGGYPGANPRDAEFFSKAKKLSLDNAVLTAFSATHRPGTSPDKDPGLNAILNSGVYTATIFGKTWDFHVKNALKVSNRENLSLIYDTVRFLKKRLETVFFDAEHFFDGYLKNPGYAMKCLAAAHDAGADCLVLCDTNGGTMPENIKAITSKVKKAISTSVGIHAHNDSECAVASSIMAVSAGARHVQGTMNGLGERTGNANLCSIIPNLQIKLGHKCISDGQLSRLRDASRFVNELANIMHFSRQPY
ncbi:MAG: citramalate synthase, partial [Thermodesulfovibrionales bacterium]|nr:citramalate synthase [Thermodesulfovibrionales bacterium]